MKLCYTGLEPHRSKPQKNPQKNIGSNHILILGEENFLIIFMNKLKLSFKNTLWFLVPSLAISAYSFFGSDSFEIGTIFDFYLIPNIPFFIASYVLYLSLEKKLNKVTAFLISNGVATGIWFLILFLMEMGNRLGHYGMEGLIIFVAAIVALIIFLMRSIFIAGHYAGRVENQIPIEVRALPYKKFSNLLIFFIGGVVLFAIFLIAKLYFGVL